MKPRRHLFLLWLVLWVALCACSCCSLPVALPLYSSIVPSVPLVLLGSQVPGRIIAIHTCQSGPVVAATSAGGFQVDTSSSDGVSITVRYTDSQDQRQLGTTALCTEVGDNVKVSQMIPVLYRKDSPGVIILAKDLGDYRGVLAMAAAILGLIVLPALGLFLRICRARLSHPALSEPVSLQYQTGESPASGLSTTQEFVKKYSEKAIGAPRYPSPRIGLKEALLLLHLRNTSSEFRDDVQASDKAHPLRDHMVVAAMLMDLILQSRITIERGLFGQKAIQVTTPVPVGDPDTDALLERLRSSRQTLKGFYELAGREHWVARLTDQLRKAGYVRLYEPMTGRFSHNLDMMHSVSDGIRVALTGALGGYKTGHDVATDDYTRILPWKFLYTSASAEEESMFAHIQSAIALHTTPGDFTQALLLLITALYVENHWFQQDYSDDSYQKSIYRFYAPHERKAVVNYLRDLAKQTQGGLHDVYRIAKAMDSELDGPPSDGPS